MSALFRRLVVATAGVLAVGVLLAAGSGSPATASTDADQPMQSAKANESFRAQIARVDGDSGVTIQQQVYCEWAWRASWTAGNPTSLTYAATFWCLPNLSGPEVIGRIWATLVGADDETLHEAPEVPIAPFDPTETASEGTIEIDRPSTQHVVNSTVVGLVPTEPGEIWVWLGLPEGCDGIGTPSAICEIHFEEFTIPG